MADVGLALGSNISDRLDALRRAIKGLAHYISVTKISHVYETPAAYVEDQPAFLNAVALGTTLLEPLPLLNAVKDLEKSLGRQPTFRNGPRIIDIDILFYDQTVLSLPELSLPHRRLEERVFVLRPLVDVAPDWQHPVTKQRASHLWASLPMSEIKDMGSLL